MKPGNEQPFESAPVQQPQYQIPPVYTSPYTNSPYANSPYASQWQGIPNYTYQQPVYTPPAPQSAPAPGEKKGSFWKTVLVSGIVAAICCGITAVGISAYWQQRNDNLSASFNEKLTVLREELEGKSYIGSGDSVSGSPGATVEGGLSPSQVYAQNVKSVVAISSSDLGGISAGSGFVLTE